jgi:hypothetical protein
MELASVVAHHLIRLQQPIEIYTSMLLKTIAHNPLVPCSTHGGGTIKINDLADFFKNTPRLHTSYTLLRIFCLLAGLRRCPPSALTLCCVYAATIRDNARNNRARTHCL